MLHKEPQGYFDNFSIVFSNKKTLTRVGLKEVLDNATKIE